MRLTKKILPGLLLVFIAIQFIQPAHNKSAQAQPADIAKAIVVPGNVQTLLQNACYDCHSNNTHYPWYSTIQPIAWMIAGHIRRGKQHLNFNGFANFTNRKQASKLKEMANQVKDGEMPLSSYVWLHKHARLTKEEKTLMTDWMNKTADSLLEN